MPINPRYNIPQSEFPTAQIPTLGADTFPSEVAGGISKIGQEGVSVGATLGAQRQQIQGRLEASSMASAFALDLDDFRNTVENAPPKTKKQTELVPDAEGFGPAELETEIVLPKSQTMVEDYERGKDALVKKYMGQASNDYVRGRLQLAIDQYTRATGLKVRDHAEKLFDQENAAIVIRDVNRNAVALTGSPVPPVAGGASPIIDPQADRAYVNLRARTERSILAARDIGGLKPDTAEKLLAKKFAEMDVARATHHATANPGAFIVASAKGTNGWDKVLTEEAYATVVKRATAAQDHLNTQLEKQRKEQSGLNLSALTAKMYSGQDVSALLHNPDGTMTPVAERMTTEHYREAEATNRSLVEARKSAPTKSDPIVVNELTADIHTRRLKTAFQLEARLRGQQVNPEDRRALFNEIQSYRNQEASLALAANNRAEDKAAQVRHDAVSTNANWLGKILNPQSPFSQVYRSEVAAFEAQAVKEYRRLAAEDPKLDPDTLANDVLKKFADLTLSRLLIIRNSNASLSGMYESEEEVNKAAKEGKLKTGSAEYANARSEAIWLGTLRQLSQQKPTTGGGGNPKPGQRSRDKGESNPMGGDR